MHDVVSVIKKVMSINSYRLLFILFAVVIFWLFLAIPVYTVPGNDFAFQLSILPKHEIFLLITLAILTALLIVFHVFSFCHQASLQTGVAAVGQGGIGYFSGAVASVFSTATCAVCVSSLFGFLGVSGVLFLVQYRMVITVVAILVLLISLYFTSRKILGICEVCTVHEGNYDHK